MKTIVREKLAREKRQIEQRLKAAVVVNNGAAVHREQRRRLLSMDFRTFVAALIHIPCQIIKASRRIRYRLLTWNQWQFVLFRMLDAV